MTSPIETFRRYSSAITNASLSVADQMVCSASNFIVIVLLTKTLTPSDFGSYSLIFAVIMVLMGFQNALVTGPMRIKGAHVDPKGDDAIYFYNQRLIGLGVQFVLSLAMVLIGAVFLNLSSHMLFLCLFMLLAMHMHEYIRIYLQTTAQVRKLLLLDVLAHGLRVLVLVTLGFLGLMSLEVAIATVAVSGLVLVLISKFMHESHDLKMGELRKQAFSSWKFGRWMLAETIVFTLSTQAILFVVAWLLTKEMVAVFSATQNLVNVINVIFMGVMGYFTSALRRSLLNDSYEKWRSQAITLATGLFLFSVVGIGILSLFSRTLLEIFYTPFYAEYYLLVPLTGLAICANSVNTVFATIYRVTNQPQVGFSARLISGVLTVLTIYPLVSSYGVYGAAFGFLASHLVWLATYVYYFSRGDLSQEKIRQVAFDV